MSKEIKNIMNALENRQTDVVNEFLKDMWEKDVQSFIETVASMRQHNANLADSHLNSGDFIQQFSVR